ncbi:MAG: sulfotransferase, partial [Gemmatimonadetes bacterium]|nr:sulfotransferase [Gemmatimonadota bacterium]
SALMVPLRLIEKMRYGRAVARTKIAHPPIFIIGHARTGTTHLHYLLTRDPQFAIVSLFQSIAPTFFLISRGWIKRFMAKQLNPKRPQDNVKLEMDLPNEEEFAIANSSELSNVHFLTFPSRATEYFEKYIFLRGLTERQQARWDAVITDIIKKATLAGGGKQLVLKSPSNTGRIPHLLRLFPNARFIHIARNPCDVYYSTNHTLRKMFELFLLEEHPGDFSDFVITEYKALMEQYLKDRALIPEGNLAEVKYEDLVADPLRELERIYATLGLSDWESGGKQAVIEYLSTLSDYQKNTFEPDPDAMARISRTWRFAFEEWNYELPVKL